jgi:long-chain acyl-CoA synthetase
MTIDLERRQESRPWLRHYDYWVPPHLNYPQRPLSYILDAAVVNRRDEPATQFGHTQLTFGNIKQRVDSFAAALAQLGVAKGDRVAIMLPNCPQYVIAAFAVLRIGAVVVNVNAAYTARELAIILDDAAPSVVIALHESAALIRDLGRAIGLRAVITTSLVDFDAAASIVDSPSGAMSFVELASSSGARPPAVAIEPEDVAVLQYTGGTTGTPKGAMLTHASIFANVVQTE